jgi:hypothetical protein
MAIMYAIVEQPAAVVWENGRLTDLGTLAGIASEARP